jgi:hypothetical protein
VGLGAGLGDTDALGSGDATGSGVITSELIRQPLAVR